LTDFADRLVTENTMQDHQRDNGKKITGCFRVSFFNTLKLLENGVLIIVELFKHKRMERRVEKGK